MSCCDNHYQDKCTTAGQPVPPAQPAPTTGLPLQLIHGSMIKELKTNEMVLDQVALLLKQCRQLYFGRDTMHIIEALETAEIWLEKAVNGRI